MLDFDNFPADPVEQLALLRFRMRKSVPFDVDSSIVSYVAQPRKKDKEKIEVLTAFMSAEIVARFEAPFRAEGFQPGLVTTSSLAALNLMQPEQVTMLVKLGGRILSVLVLDGSVIKLARCVEMDAGRPEEIETVLHPTVAYIEDELKAKPERIWLCGFGAESENAPSAGNPSGPSPWNRCARGLAYRAPITRPARLLGIGGRIKNMAIQVPINLATEPFRRDRPVLVQPRHWGCCC